MAHGDVATDLPGSNRDGEASEELPGNSDSGDESSWEREPPTLYANISLAEVYSDIRESSSSSFFGDGYVLPRVSDIGCEKIACGNTSSISDHLTRIVFARITCREEESDISSSMLAGTGKAESKHAKNGATDEHTPPRGIAGKETGRRASMVDKRMVHARENVANASIDYKNLHGVSPAELGQEAEEDDLAQDVVPVDLKPLPRHGMMLRLAHSLWSESLT